MNIQRYVLPVSIAAAFHAALIWSTQTEKPPHIFTKLISIVDTPPKPEPEIPLTLPEVEKTPESQPVKPLAGQPPPPEQDDLPVTTKTDLTITPIERTPVPPVPGVKIVPQTIGPDVGAPTGPIGGPGFKIFSGTDLDHTPRARVQRAPDYPPALSRDGVGGSVTVEFDVNTKGEVIRVEAVNYTHRDFVEPALRAVRSWRFEPGRRDGRVVPFRMVVPIEFGIESS